MASSGQAATRSVSISAQDVRDLRSEIDAMEGDQKRLVSYLVERAEASGDRLNDDFWTWTYRF